MAGSAGTRNRSEPDLLGIYLNDHLAIETGMVELARRTARAHLDSDIGDVLAKLAAEIAEDRAALRQMMAALGVPIRHYKVYAAWVGEKAGRLKLNGYVRGRSPLSVVVELEVLRLGAAGKASGWRTLREVAGRDGRLDAARLDELLSRARRQAERLEELHARTTSEVFGAQVASA
ncbi:MAG: hypothetical protein ACRDRX_02685 [Pseudonocardiaceae bacterium]